MLPLISPGDDVTIEFCEPEQLSVGDIVAYNANGVITVHRVLRSRGTGTLVTLFQSGDNLSSGTWLRRDQILGKISKVGRPDGTVFTLPSAGSTLKTRCLVRYVAIASRAYLHVLVTLITREQQRGSIRPGEEAGVKPSSHGVCCRGVDGGTGKGNL